MGEINKDLLMLGGESGPSKYKEQSFKDLFEHKEEISLEDLKLLIDANDIFDERLKKSKEVGNTTLTALADTINNLFIIIIIIKDAKKTSAEQDSIIEKYDIVFHNLEAERKRLFKKNNNNEDEEIRRLVDEIRNNLSSFVSEFRKTFDIKK